MKCVCMCARGGQRGRGWLFREVIAPANQLSQWICVVSQHNPAKKNTDNETAAFFFLLFFKNDFAKPVRFTLHLAKPYMVQIYLLMLLNQVIHYSAGSLQGLMEYCKLFVLSVALFCLLKRQIFCCSNFHFLPFTFCLSLCSGVCMACHSHVVLAIFFAC